MDDTPLPSHALLVVVHVADADQALNQTVLAFRSGADGVFLIDHSGGPADGKLKDAVQRIRATCGDEPWLGINPLGYGPGGAVQLLSQWQAIGLRLDGLWVDNADIDERRDVQPAAFEAWYALTDPKYMGWHGSYFGGVAFKYQREVADLEAAARIASRYMHYVCTSGPGTGEAIDVEKLRRLASVGHPVAVASGVSIDNVRALLPFMAAGLVATSVQRGSDFHFLDPAKIRELAVQFRTYRAHQAWLAERADAIVHPSPEWHAEVRNRIQGRVEAGEIEPIQTSWLPRS